jgi:carbon storage regulator CsrA
MLVLRRKTNEKIAIIHNGKVLAVLTILKINRNQVRLGFEADRCIDFARDEVELGYKLLKPDQLPFLMQDARSSDTEER